MHATNHINLLDLVLSVGNAVDLVSPKVAHHHKRVAYIAAALAREMGVAVAAQHELMMAGLLHDIGALSLDERVRLLEFDAGDIDVHAHVGYLLLRKFAHFGGIAELVRFHHLPWSHGDGRRCCGEPVPMGSHLLHLADRIEVSIDKTRAVLDQVDGIVAAIARGAGMQFAPEAVAAFEGLATRESFWLDIESPILGQMMADAVRNVLIEIAPDDLQDFAELLAHVIDFRNPFTATHSSGVAAAAAMLAARMSFSAAECRQMRIAGYLHDLGKLAIPTELLDKPAPLTEAEFRVIKTHVYHTFQILAPIRGLHDIVTWASLHHERLDGNGYPGRRDGAVLPLGARILAVADVFTALSEDRPYRAACSRDTVIAMLTDMAERRIVDASVVAALVADYDEIDEARRCAQVAARSEYEEFLGLLGAGPCTLQPGCGALRPRVTADAAVTAAS